jgi:cell division septation protein DedD
MRSAFQNGEADEAEQAETRLDSESELAQDPNPDREVTISTTTLLAVFFGLVLLCGLFFGLGYTFGRRSPADPTAAAPVQAASQFSDSQPKPSAAAQPAAAAPSEPLPDASAATPPDTPPQEDAPQPVAATPAVPVAKPTAPVATPVSPTPASPTATPAPAGIMVQIAAISNPADADVLVRALQQHGYSAAAYHFPTDPLIHVQIGPFANRADAVAMRQKLLSDGYNAILK